ncbi:hypothetical protein ACIBH1_00370 [Nonomuraea sp. NPDC050663]|uniref:hypothetical protein n=1 Tax=Nonomuraea sp. NPDC050663 TaxID=3364370 RepID=UPI0037891897
MCSTCTGVLPADHPEAFTPERAHLIMAHGYCSCRADDVLTAGADSPPAVDSLSIAAS